MPDSRVHGANMGLTCVLSAPPDGPYFDPMNLAIRDVYHSVVIIWKQRIASMRNGSTKCLSRLKSYWRGENDIASWRLWQAPAYCRATLCFLLWHDTRNVVHLALHGLIKESKKNMIKDMGKFKRVLQNEIFTYISVFWWLKSSHDINREQTWSARPPL